MYPALTRRASERDLVLVKTSAEALPFPDSSVDEVICSLVLCTVDDPTATIAEVLLVLRPGGTFRFVEHVAAHPTSPRRWIQSAIAKPWSWLYEDCQLCRDTGHLIEHAGSAEPTSTATVSNSRSSSPSTPPHPDDQLPRITLHALRHGWATLALEAGVLSSVPSWSSTVRCDHCA
jgi:SAM-dependent methyltransferase